MTLTIRPAQPADLDQVADLVVAGAEDRHRADPGLWRLDPSARDKTRSTIRQAMETAPAPFRQQWLVAQADGNLVGVTHSILLPVPPIYAGECGPPGLIMEGSHIARDAPPEARRALFKAAEADLTEAGARILLTSSVPGGVWETECAAHGYQPLTAYFAKTGLTGAAPEAPTRAATADDVPGIVAASAVHRSILNRLNAFWKPHDDADARFGAWMSRSLTLNDRDMFVSDEAGNIGGYAVSQPATPLHFPAPHDISGIGVIDDFYHAATEDPGSIDLSDGKAAALFRAAESARKRRGDHSVLVVCPARWQSKIELLEQLGYHRAINWHIGPAE